MEEEFIKLDAFLEFYLKEKGGVFDLDILQIVNLIDSKFPTLSWKKEDWEINIKETKPPLKRIIILVESDKFREIKFWKEDFTNLGFLLDSPSIFSNISDKDILRPYFLMACREGKIRIVRYLCEEIDCDPTEDNNYAIQLGSRYGHLKVVKYLYEKCNCDPVVNNNYAIRLASKYGHLEVVKYLYEEAGCDPTDLVNDGVIWAIVNGHREVVKYLFEEADCNLSPVPDWVTDLAKEIKRNNLLNTL